jgi:hypothetical protein
MDGRHARLVEPVLDRIPGLQRLAPEAPTKPRRTAPARAAAPAWIDGQLRPFWATLLGLGWPVAFFISMSLPPAPAHAHAPDPAWSTALAWGFLVALYATVFLASTRHRATAVAGVVAGGIIVTMSALCPVTGHHELGLWWFAQIAVLGAMLVASVLALRPSARAST